MEIEATAKQKVKIDVSEIEALRILCKVLDMDFVLDEDRDFYVNESGEVWETVNGRDKRFDDRGDLFIALRNVAVNIVPNVAFRSAPYIYNMEE